jgi:hypothetical protein
MHPLSEIENGAIGLIYWYEKTSYEMDEKQIEKLRQKNISDTLNATLMNHMYEPGKAIGDMQTVIQRGWNEAEKQKRMVEEGTEIKSELFIIGDPNTVPRLEEIERSSNFRGWSNDYIISEIKNLEC